jgi:cytochrome c551/c552
MFNSPKVYRGALVALAVWVGGFSAVLAAEPTIGKGGHAGISGIGRAATPAELAAWDIDIRPDFKGLPKGKGSVAQGQDVWEAKCASCHGIFGESNEVFSPLVGGTTAADVKTGRVARLTDPSFPGRTTLMKVPTVSTLFDYINRAMPWTQPKSLKPDEVYSVVAFLLNLGGVVPDNFILSDANVAEVQARMPNRNGMTTRHAMWPTLELGGVSKPDLQATACMTQCAVEVKVSSFLPDFARNAHGNLAEQNRLVGSQRGADTTRIEGKGAVDGKVAPVSNNAEANKPKDGAAAQNKAAIALANKHGCLTCHGMNQKVVGPAMTDIAKKYPNKTDYLATKIKAGGSGIWGPIPMPPQALSEADAKAIATWLANGAPK